MNSSPLNAITINSEGVLRVIFGSAEITCSGFMEAKAFNYNRASATMNGYGYFTVPRGLINIFNPSVRVISLNAVDRTIVISTET